MKALVIGGTGPTGPFIVNGLLQRGIEPVVLHRGKHEVEFDREIEHIHVDPHFRDEVAPLLVGREFDLAIITYGRLKVLADLMRSVTTRIISIGGTAYATNEIDAPATELSPRPVGIPLINKIVEAEQQLMAMHDARSFNISHFRYPNLFGPRQLAPKEWSVIRRILDGRREIPMLEGGLTLESRAYVENAAAAVLLAVGLPDESAGQIYNVADQHTPSDLVRATVIAEILQADVDFVSFPRPAGFAAYYWGRGRDLETGTRNEAPPTRHRLLSVRKMVDELGYSDPVDFRTAMQTTVEWYLQNPLERGGEDESVLGDPFDYEAEDTFIRLQRDFVGACEAVTFEGVSHRHAYDHPKKADAVPDGGSGGSR